MKLIDTHAHVVPRFAGRTASGPTRGIGQGRITLGGQVLQALPPCGPITRFTADTLIAYLDWAGVERAMLLQGPYYGVCNAYVRDAIRRYPERLWGAACIDPWAPGSRATFARLADWGVFSALKLECTEPTGLLGMHPGARLDEADVAWLWAELERRGLALVLDLGAVGSGSYQTGAVRRIAEQHAGLSIVICHLAQPTPRAEADAELWRLWQEQLDLAELPNVWFDSAALPAYVAEEGYPFPTAARYLRLAVERIGAERVMWGTDLPGLLVHATYPQLAALADLHTRFLPEAERDLVLWRNAEHVYGRR